MPDHLVAEIIDGELFTSPRPTWAHGRAMTLMVGDLVGGFDGPPGGEGRPGGWCIVVEPELHLGQDVLVPDIAGWRIERMPTIPSVVGVTLAPDWVCEVISPTTGRLDRTRKMPVYAREGIGHLWLVDPLARTLEVYRFDEARWTVAATHGGDETIQAEPFAALPLDMGRWWMPG